MRMVLLAGAALASVNPLAAQGQADARTVTRGPVPAWATQSEAMPVPADAQGLVFVERQDIVTHLDAKGQARFVGSQVRLLHPSALQAGNVAIVWNPSSGPPVVHTLTIHREGREIDVLTTSSFEVLRREDQLEQAALDGLLTAVLRVPDLRVGDTLEMAFTTRNDDATLGDAVSGVMLLDPAPAPGRFRMEINWEPGQEPRIQPSPGLAGMTATSPRSFVIATDNPAPLVPPKDAPPRYNWQRVAEYSDFATWSAVNDAFRPLYRDAATLKTDSPLKAEVARIAAAHADPLARARAALKLVQQQVRYVYVGLDSGNYRPVSADETWQRRYGDCKGKTALLLGMLSELGIAAEAVVVNSSGFDDGLDQRLPSPGLFDHVLVRARIAGKTYWIDGTLPSVAGPQQRPVVDYRWVLPLTAGTTQLESVSWRPQPVPDNLSLYDIDATEGFDAPARIVSTTVKRGIEGLAQHVQLSALSDTQLETAFRGELSGGEWDSIEHVSYRYDEVAAASVLTIKGTGPVDWQRGEDGERSLALPGGGFSPPGRRAREAGQNQAAPFLNKPSFSCRVTTVRLPAAAPAANWGYNSVFDIMMYGEAYYRAMERRGRTIRMVRGFRTQDREISPELARRDNERLPRFDNSMAWITFSPGTEPKPFGWRPSVPATDERDWTAPGAPCLGADMIKATLEP